MLSFAVEEVGTNETLESWSYVPASEAVMAPPLKTPRVYVETGSKGAMSIEVRYTSGGTRVPDGPPPLEDGDLPELPAWPPSLERFGGKINKRTLGRWSHPKLDESSQ